MPNSRADEARQPEGNRIQTDALLRNIDTKPPTSMTGTMAPKVVLYLWIFTVIGSGCSGEDPENAVDDTEAQSALSDDWTEYVDTLGTMSLEEPAGVVTVNPVVRNDPHGGFIVTDPDEQQVRLYSREGSLEASYGQEGSGPGEFRTPLVARRSTDGRIVVADVQLSRITVLDSSADATITQYRSPVPVPRDLVPLQQSRSYLLVARQTTDSSPTWIHRWQPDRDTVTESFFQSPLHGRLQQLGASLGGIRIDRRGDTLAIAFALTDTVYLYTKGQGDQFHVTDRIPIPFESFNITFPDPEARTNPVARNEWLEETLVIDDLFWLSDGRFIVHTGRRRQAERQQGLLIMTRQGQKLLDDPDTPELLTIVGDTAYFEHPDHLAPNRWLFGTFNDHDTK